MPEPRSAHTATRQAGAIAVRRDSPEPMFLLVTAKSDQRQWIFPKGHVEHGETPAEAARRELLEESGVDGRLRGDVGSIRFQANGHDVEVLYFLFDMQSDGESDEGRRKAWLPFADAARYLSFEDARGLLARARQLIEEDT